MQWKHLESYRIEKIYREKYQTPAELISTELY